MIVGRAGRRLLPAVLLFTAGGLASFDAAPAGAADSMTTGWWWAGRPSQTMLVTLDPVPAVSDGGLYVSSDPSGPTGISALRMQFDDGAENVVLTLAIDDTVGTPRVDACRAATSWTAEQGGTWDQRPQADCDFARVAGVRNEDGSALVFYLDPLLHTRTLDVVLTPSKQSDSELYPAFATSFRAPDQDTLSVRKSTGPSAALPGETSTDVDPPGYAPPSLDLLPAIEPFSPSGPEPVATHPVSPTAEVVATVPVTVAVAEGFRYSVILLFPLVLLGAAGYMGWALTQPVVVPRLVRPGARHGT
jgi:hypothetical protein